MTRLKALRLEQGFRQIKMIAVALDTSMDYLAGLTDVKEPYPKSF